MRVQATIWILITEILSYGICRPVIDLLHLVPGLSLIPDEGNLQVTLEVFVDLSCIESCGSWEMMNSLVHQYHHDQLNIIIEQFPQPLHKHAFLQAQVSWVPWSLNLISQSWIVGFWFGHLSLIVLCRSTSGPHGMCALYSLSQSNWKSEFIVYLCRYNSTISFIPSMVESIVHFSAYHI